MKSFPIKVGKGKSPLTLDAASLIDGCALIQGSRNSGKSYLARVIVEQTIPKGLQTIILDPEGEFSTLREKCDILIAGKDGDVPAEPRSAKVLARQIAESGVSAVVDLSGLKLQDRFLFVKIFLETLDSLPKKLERPRLVVLDEAHRYVPESGHGKAISTDAVVVLLSQGRKRGLGTILITQRLSKLKKDAAAECANFFIGKTSPVDLARAQDLLGIEKKDREALRRLESGHFYADGPGISAAEVTSFHGRQSLTTHPRPGMRHALSTPPPSSAIKKKILKEFSELPPDIEAEKAQNLQDAQAEIRALKRALVKAPKDVSDGGTANRADVEKVIETAVNKATDQLNRGAAKAHEQLRGTYGRREKHLLRALQRLRQQTAKAAEALLAAAQDSHAELDLPEVSPDAAGVFVQAKLHKPREREGFRFNPDRHPPAPHSRATVVRGKRPATSTSEAPASLSVASGGYARMLHALAQHGELSRKQLGLLTGMKISGGTFGTYISRGKQAGHWTVNGRGLEITDAGIEGAGAFEPLPSGAALVEYWCSHKAVRGRARDMLRAIVDSGEDAIGRQELADLLGMEVTGGTFGTYLSILRSLNLISKTEPFVAAEALRE